MTTRPEFERSVAAWLTAAAGEGTPDYLDEIETRVAGARQRAWWSSLERWLPMDLTARATSVARPSLGRALVVAILLVALLAAALLIVGSRQRVPPPFGPAGNGAIVYSDRGDLYAYEPGAQPRLLIGGDTIDVGPLFSRDGTRLAFLRQASGSLFDYFVVRPDGSDLRRLTAEPLRDPDDWDWSPDGNGLVVWHNVDGQRVLSVVPTDGSGEIRRLDTAGLTIGSPAWRPPTGAEITFRGRSGAETTALYSIRADGTDLHAIAPTIAMNDAYSEPRLSPDGRLVTYVNYSEPDGSEDGVGGRAHVLDLKTGLEHRVTSDSSVDYETQPQFSPDGTQIAYLRLVKGEPLDVMLVPMDRHAPPRRVGPPQPLEGEYILAFSPDGRELFLGDRKGRISVIDIETGSIQLGPDLDDWAHWQRLAP